MLPVVSSVDPVNKWTSRIIPAILLALVVIGLYVVTGRVCADILIPNGEIGSAIVILILLYLFTILMVICYLRTFLTILYNSGVVPLGPSAVPKKKTQEKDVQTYNSGPATEKAQRDVAAGMAQFYTKDLFQCTETGAIRWCSMCENWKPDRAHHSKELGRCVRKMDHYCPWMGGIISETSFKYFIQFNMYAAFFCMVCLGSTAYILHKQVSSSSAVDLWVAIILGLAGFFGLFTFTLCINSMRFAFLNLTTIDSIDSKVNTYFLALRIKNDSSPGLKHNIVRFPPEGLDASAGSGYTFAIVQTLEGESPWDLGYLENWKSIMGETWIDWLLPIRPSPELSFDSSLSDYPIGDLYVTLMERHGLLWPDDSQRRRKR